MVWWFLLPWGYNLARVRLYVCIFFLYDNICRTCIVYVVKQGHHVLPDINGFECDSIAWVRDLQTDDPVNLSLSLIPSAAREADPPSELAVYTRTSYYYLGCSGVGGSGETIDSTHSGNQHTHPLHSRRSASKYCFSLTREKGATGEKGATLGKNI